MTDDQLFAEIQDLISAKLGISKDKIQKASNIRNDLGADSLDTFDLIYEVEDKYKITINDEVVNRLETVNDVFEFIKSEVSKK